MKRQKAILKNKRTLRILILFQSDFPDDVRLSREIEALKEEGHRIRVICNNRLNRPEQEVYQGCVIHRLPQYNFVKGRIYRWITTPSSANPLWFIKIINILNIYHVDVIHVVNLPLAALGIVIGKALRKKVVYDMFENYPEAIKSWKLKGIKSFTRSPQIAQFVDDFCAKFAHAIIVVVQEAAERLIKRGVENEKISIVENTIDLHRFKQYPIDQNLIHLHRNGFNLVYTGQFSEERGLETVIKAIPIIKNEIPNVKLILVGSGPSKKNLEKMVEMLKISEFILFVGWVDYMLFPTYISLANVCIIPQPSNPFIDTTMPNKIYEYMAMGKPVLTSDATPLKRVIQECQCGETFKSNSATDFYKMLLRIKKSRKPYGVNGIRAVEKKYNWVISSRTLRRLYRNLEKE